MAVFAVRAAATARPVSASTHPTALPVYPIATFIVGSVHRHAPTDTTPTPTATARAVSVLAATASLSPPASPAPIPLTSSKTSLASAPALIRSSALTRPATTAVHSASHALRPSPPVFSAPLASTTSPLLSPAHFTAPTMSSLPPSAPVAIMSAPPPVPRALTQTQPHKSAFPAPLAAGFAVT